MQSLTCESIYQKLLIFSLNTFSQSHIKHILHLGLHGTVLNLILGFFRYFHIPNADSIPERLQATHSATNKKPSKYPDSKEGEKKSISNWKNKRKRNHYHLSSQHRDILVSESFIMTNKGAALKYKHICSRDPDSRLSWLRVLLQPGTTSQMRP